MLGHTLAYGPVASLLCVTGYGKIRKAHALGTKSHGRKVTNLGLPYVKLL